MILTLDEIDSYLPTYLTKEQKEGFLRELKDFPNCNFYMQHMQNEVLQGDGWSGFEIFDFDTGIRRGVRAIVLSNSCDIAPENARAMPTRITVAPLIAASKYERLLVANGIAQSRINSIFEQLRKQLVTSAFYLPKGGALNEDHFAFLEDVHSLPTANFLANTTRGKLYTLSQVGFYLFLMKLSIHFCRMHEGVNRSN